MILYENHLLNYILQGHTSKSPESM